MNTRNLVRVLLKAIIIPSGISCSIFGCWIFIGGYLLASPYFLPMTDVVGRSIVRILFSLFFILLGVFIVLLTLKAGKKEIRSSLLLFSGLGLIILILTLPLVLPTAITEVNFYSKAVRSGASRIGCSYKQVSYDSEGGSGIWCWSANFIDNRTGEMIYATFEGPPPTYNDAGYRVKPTGYIFYNPDNQTEARIDYGYRLGWFGFIQFEFMISAFIIDPFLAIMIILSLTNRVRREELDNNLLGYSRYEYSPS